MSVFKKFKSTFVSAQQEVVDGFRALTSIDSQSRIEQLRSIKSRDINLDAGADLLYSYQKSWSAIQTDTKECAKKAEEANALLSPLFKTWDKQADSVAQLEEEVTAIPQILSTLQQLQTLLDALRQDFIVAEKGLDVLENLCEEQEFQNRKREEQKRLAVYKAQREAEAEKTKVDLAKRHAKKMASVEYTKRMNLQERAQAFTSAFQDDVNFYRTHGHPDRVPTEFPKVSSLSEIEIEEDKQALDSFLGPDGEGATDDMELAGDQEGAYFEDDYTADFSAKQGSFAVKQDDEFVDDIDYISSNVLPELNLTAIDEELSKSVEDDIDDTEEKGSHAEKTQKQSDEKKESGDKTEKTLEKSPEDAQNDHGSENQNAGGDGSGNEESNTETSAEGVTNEESAQPKDSSNEEIEASSAS